MNTTLEDELSTKREIARALVDELIGSVVLEHSSKDINVIIQQELNELEHDLNELEDEVEVDEVNEVKHENKVNDNVDKKNITGAQLAKLSAEYSESLELQNGSHPSQNSKHVRFDNSCNTHKGLTSGNKKKNDTVIYLPTSGFNKFAWFMTGVIAGVIGSYLIRPRRF